MRCLRCHAENGDGARCCRECGATFGVLCPGCGATVEAGSKFCDRCGTSLALAPAQPAASPRFTSPERYTPEHLAEKILSSRTALEGERKQVTVLFADLRGSMELVAERDPEEGRKLLDPVLDLMMEAVHRYEGTVNQVMGDGIMALFGAPLAHEDHAVRACYAALRMQESPSATPKTSVAGPRSPWRSVSASTRARSWCEPSGVISAHLAAATIMYREMGMRFWLERAAMEMTQVS
jgi:hypothetical protein